MNIIISSMDSELGNLINRTEERGLVGTVVDIFDKVINIETNRPDMLITLAKDEVIRGPLMIKVKNEKAFDHLKRTAAVGNTVTFKKNGQGSLNNDRLLFHSSISWQSLIPPMEVNETQLLDLQHTVDCFLIEQGNIGGIGNAYLTKSLDSDDRSNFQSAYDRYFRQLLQQLTKDFNGESLKKFIGLGVGLTPSGDDFLTGLLAALYHYDTERLFLAPIRRQLRLDHIEGKTTRVSKYMLYLALDGQFNEALLALFDSRVPVAQSLDKVNSIGSTSGTDMLSGVGFALEQLRIEYKRRDKLEHKGND
ncbi:Protein of unknown function [Alkalibacterium putridalgicola]|uniref:DUF2877 domain-containing protein n=1 Tax=Alkalibacterium putridalgicola TaxID=426703 RepID=A0A1H7UTJ9_9LACT|nr:DUF2877 domain-containing protein [Alkalibacterium putridalgicola]GEK88492.1 hypothetical protein APU01nite_05310 [Alkalibacterium putridalgicola]SEL99978.1 Protein of unknown function [Alkalibacterium putridalgicola]